MNYSKEIPRSSEKIGLERGLGYERKREEDLGG